MARTTIAIQDETRARIREAAEHESKTIDAFLRSLLDEHEKSRFWGTLASLTPSSYASAMADDLDSLDEGHSIEDLAIDSEIA